VIARAGHGPLGVLGGPVPAQDGDGGPVQGDRALASPGLRLAGGQVPAVLLKLLADHGCRAV
jgi:hypothetical protein